MTSRRDFTRLAAALPLAASAAPRKPLEAWAPGIKPSHANSTKPPTTTCVHPADGRRAMSNIPTSGGKRRSRTSLQLKPESKPQG